MLFAKVLGLIKRATTRVLKALRIIRYREGDTVFLKPEATCKSLWAEQQKHLNVLGFQVVNDVFHYNIVHVRRKIDKREFRICGTDLVPAA
jgi:hypothetical protein